MKNTYKLYIIAFTSLLLFSCSKEIEVSVIDPDIDVIDPDIDMMDDLSGEGIISEFALINDIGLELIPVNQSIDQEEKTISLEYSFGTDVSSLFTKIKISDEATITPKEGEKVDFTQLVNFIVTAANGTENSYKVTATTPKISEKQALLNMASALPNNTLNWSTETDITTWSGITVENGNVTGLNVAYPNNTIITSDIKNLIYLKSITLINTSNSQTGIRLPDEIGLLKQLETFSSSTGITGFPEALTMNINLKSIFIDDANSIDKIPENIGNLKKLESLTLKGTLISNLPESIAELALLRTLNLSNNQQLVEIPNTLGNLSNLGILDLTRNNLSSLPESIGKLTNLTSLNLFSNKLTTLPRQIGDLKMLSILSFENNLIKEIPSEFGNLTNLTFLVTIGNPDLKTVPQSVCDIFSNNEDLINNLITDGAICQ